MAEEGKALIILFRIILPLFLLTAAVVRFNVLSFMYAIFLLICPHLRISNGATGIYLCIVFVSGFLGILTQSVFNIFMKYTTDTNKAMFSNCTRDERIARMIAVERFTDVPNEHIIRLMLPDVAVFVTGSLVYILRHRSLRKETTKTSLTETSTKLKRRTVWDCIGNTTVVVLLAASGIITPSVISILYFLSFLGIVTWWSYCESLLVKIAIVRYVVLVYSALHFLALHVYQIQFFQDLLPSEEYLPRLLGLTGIVKTDCSTPWMIMFHDISKWQHFVNPAIILLLYGTLAFQINASQKRQKLKPNELDDSLIKSEARKKKQNKESSEEQWLMDKAVPIYRSMEQVHGHQDQSESIYAMPDDNATYGEVHKRTPKIFVFIMRHNYILTLIAMMAWSITFHSWLTFVLLLAACVIWIIPESRRNCLLLSPVIMFYGEGLLIIQFVYGMDIPQLPVQIGNVDLAEFGLKKFTYPVLQLAVQVVYTLMFWMSFRQRMCERISPILAEEYPIQPINNTESSISRPVLLNHPVDAVFGVDSPILKGVVQYIHNLLRKYWIIVCVGWRLVRAMQDVTIHRIAYMAFFLIFLLFFQLCYKWWHKMMLLFWWTVVAFSMLILIILYAYQFKNIYEFWHDNTDLSKELHADLGLKQFDTEGLFTILLTPTIYLIIVILQVRYFHEDFKKMSKLDRYSGHVPPDDMTETFKIDDIKKAWRSKFAIILAELWLSASKIWVDIASCLWRLAEVHIHKLVSFTIIMVAVSDVSLIGAVYVTIVAVFMPFTGCRDWMSHITQLWTIFVLLSKMIFQLQSVDTNYFLTNCTATDNSSKPHPEYLDKTIDNAIWVGLHKTDGVEYFRRYVGILVILVLERVIKYHQIQYFNKPGLIKPKDSIIFPQIKRSDADTGIQHCIMYLMNYSFYRFGLEVCYIMTAITICVRVDVFAVIYAIFLGISLCLSRRGNKIFWRCYIIILVILLIMQYISSLGLPMWLCTDYPWGEKFHNLEKFLRLPNFHDPPSATKLIADFFQLLFVTLQWRVFSIEPTHPPDESDPLDKYDGGDNLDIVNEVEAKAKIPVKDFTKEIKSYLDALKNFVFVHMFWVTLFIMFIAGTVRTRLFGFGYVIAVLWFLFRRQEFRIAPYSYKDMVRKWNFLIGYCFLVLLLESCLQLPSCAYMQEIIDNFPCWVIQILGIACINPGNPSLIVTNCTIEMNTVGLAWDVTCFAFLLLQRRIIMSHYFRHVVANIRDESVATRFANCINGILRKSVLSSKKAEEKLLEKIQERVKKLKEKQQSLKHDYTEPVEHYQAIRSGDSYLFEDSEEEDIEGGRDEDIITFDQNAKEKWNKRHHIGNPDKQSDDPEFANPPEPVKDLNDSSSDSFTGERYKTVKEFLTWLIRICNDGSAKYRIVEFQMKNVCQEEKVNQIMKPEQQTVDLQRPLQRSSIEEEDTGAEGAEELETSYLEMVENIPGITLSYISGFIHSRPKDETDIDMVHITNESVESLKSFDVNLERHHEIEEKWKNDTSLVDRIFVAIYYLLAANSEFICYFLMILNHLLSGSLLSLPLPLFMFMWGMISTPRPTRTFWRTVIIWTVVIFVLKYVLRPFSDLLMDLLMERLPLWLWRIIGIENASNSVTMDLVLLLALFIHRSILKRSGLWTGTEAVTAEPEESQKTEFSGNTAPQRSGLQTYNQNVIIELEEEDETEINAPDAPQYLQSAPASQQENLNSLTVTPQQESHDLNSLTQESQQEIIDLNSATETMQTEADSATQQLNDREKSRMETEQQSTERSGQSTLDVKSTTDVYVFMFICDFINFLIMLIAYVAFWPVEPSVRNIKLLMQENKVPAFFLLMFVIQLVQIIVDRALYLKKDIKGKKVIQIILVIGIHIWLFIAVPSITGRKFTENTAAQLLYFVKCIYFGLSAYQIKCGYPTRMKGIAFTSDYSKTRLLFFKIFLCIPFLLELRSLMDYIWTDTTLDIPRWFKMEEIFAKTYVLKCSRTSEMNDPKPRSKPRSHSSKYLIGGLYMVVIVIILVLPLLVFFIGNKIYVANPPIECQVSVAIAGYQPLFTVSALEQDITRFTDADLDYLQDLYEKDRDFLDFLNGFSAEDITRIRLESKSMSFWDISPPSEQNLLDKLKSDNSVMKLDFFVSFTRAPRSGEADEIISNNFIRPLSKGVQNQLALMIQNVNNRNNSITIEQVFPYYIHLPATGRAKGVSLLNDDRKTLMLTLNQSSNFTGIVSGMSEWWTIGTAINKSNDDMLEFVTFNDRIEPEVFTVFKKYGIIGLYISLVLVLSKFVGDFFREDSSNIMFTELPYVDNILKLCQNIYLVREVGDFYLEEELFAKLLFLYRCPQTLMKWTKYRSERKLKVD